MRFSFALLVAMLMALPACAETTVKIGGITWYTNLDAALQVAREQHRPLWVHFGENPG